jgi:hypothetical protein
MPSRLDYARLLAELNDRFADADGQAIRDWLQQQSTSERVRHDTFVPTSLTALETATFPPLQSGDILASPILAQSDRFHIPAHCQLESPVQVLGTLHLERDVQAAETLSAEQQIIWHGGTQSELQNLVAPRIKVESPAGTVRGGIWCDALSPDASGAHLPPKLRVHGVIVVDKPDAPIVVGHEAELGGLVVQGAVRTEHGVTISHLSTRDGVLLGRHNHIGYVEAATVQAERDSHLGVVVSRGTAQLGAGCVVDSLRAEGDITFDGEVTVTGDLLVSQTGTMRIPASEQWCSQRNHWFYALPDQTLIPYRPDAARPEGSALLALRSLTHSLWQQTHQVAGRTP